MTNFLKEELGVAMSGVKWDVAGFKLYQSTNDNIILFVPTQPRIAVNPENGRYQIAVSSFRQQKEGTYKITGGSAIFTITSAVQFDSGAFEAVKQQWISEMKGKGPQPPNNPKFVPLNIRKGKATVLINPISGKPNAAHNDPDVGTPGGTNSFLVELTDLGAQEWVQGIKNKTNIPAGVKFSYEYMQFLPTCGARVHADANRVFQHISTALNVSYEGWFYGGSTQIEAAWESMRREGIIDITFVGTLPPELESIRQNLVTTFSDQAREQLFDSLFKPAPDIKPAQAGDTKGCFGGANFAFKYKSVEEVTDLDLTLKFEGWTWLNASMDADVTTLFANLDNSYINEVNTEVSFPAAVVVDADPMLSDVAVSWSPSEGHWPEAPVFGINGGQQTYTITSSNPDNVTINYDAKVNFTPANWPVIETKGSSKVSEGGNTAVIKPSSWIGRHMIYMFVKEGDQIKLPDENDYAICNVSYRGSHLKNPIKASSKITPMNPLEFSYPLSPAGNRGTATFSALAIIDKHIVMAKEQEIKFDEEAVFILASKDGIQLVSESSILPEAGAELEKRLLAAKARPVVRTGSSEGPAAETEKKPTPAGDQISGTVIAVECDSKGAALVVETASGSKSIVRLHERSEANPFIEHRKQVTITLDSTGTYAEKIRVNL